MEESSEVKEAEAEAPEGAKIRVVARVRPLKRNEIEMRSEIIVTISGNTLMVRDAERDRNVEFKFDSCHPWSADDSVVNKLDGDGVPDGPESQCSGQVAFFEDVGLKMIDAAWQGYNATAIAYGQTGSGKSFTMLGPNSDPGLTYLCCRHLFSELEKNPQNKYKVTVSLMEIYNEKVIDLLSKTATNLQIREKPSGLYVQDLTVMLVKSVVQTVDVVMQGLQNRMIAATKMNSTSSRSHLIITVKFVQYITEHDGTRTKRHSRMRFVDLAGSERASKTGATGEVLREAQIINRSLSGLGAVLDALSPQDQQDKKKRFAPYRSSKLTRLLQDELGGNCVTTIIAACSPSDYNVSETINTLRFVVRAKHVVNKLKADDLNVDESVKTHKAHITEKENELLSADSEDKKAEMEGIIEKHRLKIRHLEAPWLEKESIEKNFTWWSTAVNLQQQELDTNPYIQNISQDTLLSGITKHILPQGHILAGKSDSDKVKLHLSGLGIQECHAVFVNTGTTLSIAPCSSRATVHVNGRNIHTMKELAHLDHIKLGAGEVFIVIGFPDVRETGNVNDPKHTYEKCLTEVAEQHRLSRKLRGPPGATVRMETAALVKFQEFTDLLQQAEQAQALGVTFGKNILFDPEVLTDIRQTDQLLIRVFDHDLNMEWLWRKVKFEEHKLMMDQLYDRYLSTGKVPAMSLKNNPFCDAESPDIYLGRYKVSLHNTAYLMPVSDTIFMYDFRGRLVGSVHVSVTPCTSEGEPLPDTLRFQDPQELTGKLLHLRCSLPRFSHVLWVAGHPNRGIYCKVWMNYDKEVHSTEVVYGTVHGSFQASFQFTLQITKNDVNSLLYRGLTLELWGKQTLSLPTPETQPPTPMQAPTTDDSSNLQRSESIQTTTTISEDMELPSEDKETSLQDKENAKTKPIQHESSGEQLSQKQGTQDEITPVTVRKSSLPAGESTLNSDQGIDKENVTPAAPETSLTDKPPSTTQQGTEERETASLVNESLPEEKSLSLNAQPETEDKKATVGESEKSLQYTEQNAEERAVLDTERKDSQEEALVNQATKVHETSPKDSTVHVSPSNRNTTDKDSAPMLSTVGESSQSDQEHSQNSRKNTMASVASVTRTVQSSQGNKPSSSCVCM